MLGDGAQVAGGEECLIIIIMIIIAIMIISPASHRLPGANRAYRAEYTNLGAGRRYCAVSSEHRGSTTERKTVEHVSLECWLGDKNVFRF